MIERLYINGRSIEYDKSRPLNSGKEGYIFKVGWKEALKVYRKKDDPYYDGDKNAQKKADERIREYQQKLPDFPTGLPRGVVVPYTNARDSNGIILGYTMELIEGTRSLVDYGDQEIRQEKNITESTVITIFRDLHRIVTNLHHMNVIIGDFKDTNVLVKNQEIHIVDADSFQFYNYLCRVYTPEFTDPKLLAKHANEVHLDGNYSKNSDWYAYNVMLMQNILFTKPYDGVYEPKSSTENVPDEERPLRRITIFDKNVIYPPFAMPFTVLPYEVVRHFIEVFEQDKREIFPVHLLDILEDMYDPQIRIRRKTEEEERGQRIKALSKEGAEGIKKASYIERGEFYKGVSPEEALEDWCRETNRIFNKYKDSSEEDKAKFVLQRLGLDLFDQNLAKKIYTMFFSSIPTNKQVDFFVETITNKFNTDEVNRHKQIIFQFTRFYGEESAKALQLIIEERPGAKARQEEKKRIDDTAKRQNMRKATRSRGVLSNFLKGWKRNVEFESLRFYESGKDMPETSQRRYSTHFSKSAARLIWLEINMKNLQRRRDQTYQVVWRYYSPDGSLMRESQRDFVVKSNWETWWYSGGWGWEAPGHWTPGTYRVEVLIDGDEITEGSFTIG